GGRCFPGRPADSEPQAASSHRLVDQGNTVLLIEHNLDVIAQADHLIDLGPEGGDGGGMVVASGTPEQLALCKDSYTGYYLAQMFHEKG
ncbi:MAG TPA: hypothetical protein PKN79_01920, partial [Sphaerochaeta sp.]|nr:hypothetical protein [Sphaerochaeta sp.]